MEKQKINTADTKDRDVFGYAVDKGWMCVQILYMRQGKMIQRHSSAFPFYGEAYSDFMSYVTQYYSDNPALPQEILLPEEVSEGTEKPSGASAAAAVTAGRLAAELDAEDDGEPEAESEAASAVAVEAASGAAALQEWLGLKVLVRSAG